ncbi:hypothetical protein [Streptomyces sp. NPDC096339]|uniref:hypothetical protein n=1 Tax=Streptomyces sp. NPDC096339 TaxID=3366086 RepID=UPI0037FA65C4
MQRTPVCGWFRPGCTRAGQLIADATNPTVVWECDAAGQAETFQLPEGHVFDRATNTIVPPLG